jgi:hypothetical protein
VPMQPRFLDLTPSIGGCVGLRDRKYRAQGPYTQVRTGCALGLATSEHTLRAGTRPYVPSTTRTPVAGAGVDSSSLTERRRPARAQGRSDGTGNGRFLFDDTDRHASGSH